MNKKILYYFLIFLFVVGAAFIVYAQGAISITSPAKDEIWLVDETKTLSWDWSGFTPRNISVYLVLKNSGTKVIIGSMGAQSSQKKSMIHTIDAQAVSLFNIQDFSVSVCDNDFGICEDGPNFTIGQNPAVIKQSLPVLVLPSVGAGNAPIFLLYLMRGMRGDEVSVLQSVLKSDPSIYPEGVVSGFFGSLTKRAVQRFQMRYNIAGPGTLGYGTVGPVTRKKLNQLYRTSKVSAPSTSSSAITSPVTQNLTSSTESVSLPPLSSQTQVSSETGNNISTCREINTPGTYTLTNNLLSSRGTTCLSVRNTNNITINCNNHSIVMDMNGEASNNPAVSIENTSNFDFESCVITVTNNLKNWPANTVKVSQSMNGKISKNIIGDSYMHVENSSGLVITGNTFNSYYQQRNSSNSLIADNIFDPKPKHDAGAALIGSTGGSNNTIRGNTIDGKSDGIFENKFGFDDGIVVEDESGDVVEGNTLKNFYDCGIETSGFIQNTKIIRNNIKNSGLCGIGGWYWNSWRENTVSQNTVDTAAQLFAFFRIYGMRPQDTIIYFQNNIFSSNSFINPDMSHGATASRFDMVHSEGGLSQVAGERPAVSSDFITGNNQLISNDFGKAKAAPYISSISIIFDGGGNTCGQIPSSDYPLKCN